MKYIKFSGSNKRISNIGIGTWRMGVNPKNEINAINYALDNGINFIDTAQMYGTEWLVGQAIVKRDRESLFIATKVSPHNFSYADVINSCMQSLKALKTDYIDLYQLHFPSSVKPIKETMRAMEYLKNEGYINHIGVSNFNKIELQYALQNMNNSPIISNQVEYNVFVRDIEGELMKYCMDNKISIIAYRPLVQGMINSKKYSRERKIFTNIGLKNNATPIQIMLAWLIAKKALAIPKASSIAHVKENLGASDIKLNRNDMAMIDTITKRRKSMMFYAGYMIRHTTTWSKLMTNKNKKIERKQF